MKTINALASKIAKLEGKKSQVRIGDIREIIGILSDLLYEKHTEQCCSYHNITYCNGPYIEDILCRNGQKRAKKKAAAKKRYEKYLKSKRKDK